jgi:hypothetical protein
MQESPGWAVAIWLRKAIQFILALMILSILSGCMMIQKRYIDSTYENTHYKEIAQRAEPHKWRLAVEFQSDGSHSPNGDSFLMQQVERVIASSGIAVSSTEKEAPELKVVVNNIADIGSAFVKSFFSVLTIGLVGFTATDHYEMQIALSKGNVVITKTGYKHTLYTNMGFIVSAPSNAVPTSDGFGKIVEQMLLAALKDLEKDSQIISISSIGFDQPLILPM